MIMIDNDIARHAAGLFSPERDKIRTFLAGAVAGIATLALSAGLAMAQFVGPSTTKDPYVLPSHADVKTASILTVGDLPAGDGYRMVGIPDGMGALNINRRFFKLMMNHELGATAGIAREHGSKGAFVSEWLIERDTLEVVAGQDHAPDASYVFSFNPALNTWLEGTVPWNRFCAADLPEVSAFYFTEERKKNGKKDKSVGGRQTFGTDDRIYLNGEESANGKAWAHLVSGAFEGESWELPRLGKMSFENVVASPHAQRKTVVMLLEDGSADTRPNVNNGPSNLYVYIGRKQTEGHPIEQAGLTNGKLYGVRVYAPNRTVIEEESNQYGLGNATVGFRTSARFDLVEIGENGDVSSLTEPQIEQLSIDQKILRMQRVEDGAWDPRRRHRNDFYFVTTASFTTNSRLWRLRFDDVEKPENGGRIEILLKGDEGQKMLDNIVMDRHGRLIMQEDPGNQAHLAKIWLYGTGTENLVEIGHHNPKFFDPNANDKSRFLTADEESSGVIDAQEILGRGWFLFNVQAHANITNDPELVQHGQLLALYVDPELEKDDDIDF